MATRRQPLIPGWLIPGISAATLVVAVALAAFLALWWNAPQGDWVAVWQDSYLWHVVRFSFWQAFLSALLSVVPAIFLARALYRRRFPGRQVLLRLCAMTLILPVLVAVFGILSVYGRQGWLASLWQSLGLEWTFSPYGLQGILLAHVFFNLPMASRLLLQALENIPGEQRQLAAQLGMRGWHFFRFVEWPWLRRQIPPVAALIFMLCFASFATVLSLGGGPQATTIELAIYQALSYDYDPARAAMLALIQMVCCLGLVLLSQRLSKAIAPGTTLLQGWRDPDDRLHSRICDTALIVLALLLLLPPLLAVIVDGVNRQLPEVLAQPVLWQALWTSLRIALAAGVLCVVLTMMLLWSSRELRARQKMLAGQALEMSGMLILAMPGIVLATGFFLLLNNTIGLPQSADGIVIFTNALMAIPYALKVLENPMRDITARYSMLCQSLGIEGWSRLKVVELRALKRPLAQALAFACVLSIGDFGVVALFGNDDFRTLPFYLYQQIGSYRSQDGAVTALILLLLCFLLFTVIEKYRGEMLKLTDITWLYHHLPMRFSLTVERGEQVAILRPSGAGKSTLLNLIAGFLTPASGLLTLDGVDHTTTPPSRRPVSMLFQENNLFSHLTVAQNIGLGLNPGLKLNAAQQKKMHAIAHQMGIDNLMARLPGELSGGQRQRVALARCLVREQPILLLDEPFSALDPALRQEMLTLVSSSCQQQKMTLLMVSHSVEDAARIATRSVVVADGRIAWQGKTDELLSGKASASALLGIKG